MEKNSPRKTNHRLFDVRAGEWAELLLTATPLFLALFTFWVFKPLKRGLFLGYYKAHPLTFFGWTLSGAETEQLAKVANVGGAYLLMVLLAWLGYRFKRREVIAGLSVVAMMLTAFFAFAADAPSAWTVWAFYIFSDLFNTTSLVLFWAFVNDAFTAERATRLYGLIGLGGVLGGLAGSSVARWGVPGFGREAVLWLCVLLILLLGLFGLRVLSRSAFGARPAAQVSFSGFQKYDAELTLPKLLEGRASLNVYGVHHNYPQLQYYGSGADSLKGNRTNYRLEDTALDVTFGVQPIPHLRELTIAASTGYVWNNVGPGTNNQWASTEKVFTPAQAIGVDQQTDFFRYGGFAQFDWRDNPGGPRRGGYYLAQVSRYEDRKRKLHDFTRLDLELQQYLPFFNERRVIALRARTTLTDTKAGQSVPFYLQPTLGGLDTLRGYRPFRFADNNSLLLSAEYRYEVFSGLDMALFADAGKVTARRGQINFKDLESSVGFGFRFNVRNNVFMRVETAFSHEGFQVIVRFNPVFRTGPTRTSSSQGEF